VYGKTRREVVEKLDGLRGSAREGLAVASGRQTVGSFLDEWLVEAEPARGARTMARYRTVARLYLKPRLGYLKLSQIGPQHIQALQRELLSAGLAPRTVLKVRDVLSGALGQAERWRLISRNPVELVELPKVHEVERRVLTRVEAIGFLEAIRGNRLEALYLVALALGLRRGEALGLKGKDDVDWTEGAIRVRRQLQRVEHGGGRQLLDTKSRAGVRTMYLPEIALAKLREHLQRQNDERLEAGERWQEHGLVFPSTVGTPMEPRNLNRAWDALRKRLGMPDLKLHGLRHSAASLYLALGVPPHVVQGIIGHADPSTTMTVYAHVNDADRREAARLMNEALR
jgi:integrase